jgi:ABC-type transport system involved in multi-copper enzyme maturation permease subunit
MAKIKHLVAGEFQRLTKYNLFTASFFVALIWIGLGIFLDPEEFRMFLPFVFLMEASAMTALLVGAQMYYEKKEHTISSMLISPISSSDYIISKILTNIINLIIIFGVIFLSMYFHQGYDIQLSDLVDCGVSRYGVLRLCRNLAFLYFQRFHGFAAQLYGHYDRVHSA